MRYVIRLILLTGILLAAGLSGVSHGQEGRACSTTSHVPDTYPITTDTRTVGRAGCYIIQQGDTLLDVARENGLGYNEITAANPDVDPWVPLAGTEIDIPGRWILPPGEREGIILNIAELRLYCYYVKDGTRMVATYPIGIGKEGADTPPGTYQITEIMKDPFWYPPKSILKEKPGLPEMIRPGPDNPLGRYKMRLGHTSYLLHGTNKPYGIGRRVSHGCIRLYPEDVEELFGIVMIGTKVRVVYLPVKAALVGGRLYAEVHDEYFGSTDLVEQSLDAVQSVGGLGVLDTNRLYDALTRKDGMPTDVTLGQSRGGRPPTTEVRGLSTGLNR